MECHSPLREGAGNPEGHINEERTAPNMGCVGEHTADGGNRLNYEEEKFSLSFESIMKG